MSAVGLRDNRWIMIEIHQIRQKMLVDAGGNIEVLLANFRAPQAAQGGVVIIGKLPRPALASGAKHSDSET